MSLPDELTTNPDRNGTRQNPITTGHHGSSVPGERPFPTRWAYFASRGSGLGLHRFPGPRRSVFSRLPFEVFA
jgi:hypothetical protein